MINGGVPRPRSGGSILVAAHRGNAAGFPENTLPAFRSAMDEGADLIETDLQLTADDVFVSLHDETVDRTTEGHGNVGRMPFAEVRGLGIRGDASLRIPSLEEICATRLPGVALMLELKSRRFEDPAVCAMLVGEMRRLEIERNVVVVSFHASRLKAFRASAPGVPAGHISLSPFPPRTPELLGPLWPLLVLNPSYVKRAHERGQLVCPLDPHPDDRLRLYRRLGCDAVLTDDPGTTIRALRDLDRLCGPTG